MKTYTIFQLKETVVQPADALDQDASHTSIPLSDEFPLEGTLYLGVQRIATPSWVALLAPHLQAPLPNVHTAGISAVLILGFQDRFYAFTFGHGRSLLNPSSWVRNFGLKATLNRVNPKKLRSMDSRVYDELVVSTRKQTSRSSTVDNFDVDINRSLLKGVTGDAEDGEALSRFTGADGLRVTTRLPFTEIEDVLEEVVAAHEDNAYQVRFGWIDNIREVEASQTPALDDLLVAALIDGDPAPYLAPPDTIDWMEVGGFNYTCGRPSITYLELNLSDYLAILQAKEIDISISLLKRHKVRIRDEADDELHDRWPIYDCLVWETTHNHRRFVFFDGLWFEIDANYAERVSNFVETITSTSITFPDAIAGEDEEIFSARMASDESQSYALLDQINFRAESAASDIEFCDVLSTTSDLIHIKKRYSSASLSHLFSQGAVAAELFLQDQLLRDRVRQRLIDFQLPEHAALITTARPVPGDYQVVYAIIAGEDSRGWPPPLQFFSAVNLMHHATRLQNLGFRVSLQYIRQL